MLFCVITSVAGAQDSVTVWALKGPSGVGMIRLFENVPQIPKMTVKVDAYADAQLMAAAFIKGDAKIGILPPNLAAKIASTGKQLQIAAVTGQGMLSLLTTDASVKTIDDLKGRSISVAGQGAVPEYVFRKILLEHGLNPDSDVRFDFSLAYPEIAQSIITGRIQIALLPEPFATMALMGNKNTGKVSDIKSEWIKSGGPDNFPLTVLMVDGIFARKNPAAVRIIMNSVRDSINWVTENPVEAGALVEKHGLGLKAPVVAASIPNSNYVYVEAPLARPSLEALFKVFLEFAPASIGGSMPKNTFYFNPRNPR